ncbi:hypothetical protein BC835DRAFT_1307426 [Cytidiella melzeri]|nr:hypothetical protein BC835DRAFT_1307426 [Cytidiella melzeri]
MTKDWGSHSLKSIKYAANQVGDKERLGKIVGVWTDMLEMSPQTMNGKWSTHLDASSTGFNNEDRWPIPLDTVVWVGLSLQSGVKLSPSPAFSLFFVYHCGSRRDTIPPAGGTPETLAALEHSVSWTEHSFVVSNQQMLCPVATFKVPFDKLYGSYPEHVQLFSVCTDESRKYSKKCQIPFNNLPRAGYATLAQSSYNISMQWDKHHVVYASNTNLPWEMIEKGFSVKFLSSSPHASTGELAKALNGGNAWDCKYDKKVLLLPYAFLLATIQCKQRNAVTTGLVVISFAKFANVVLPKLIKLEKKAFLGYYLFGHSVDDWINPLLGLAVLLGVVKYFWRHTVHIVEKTKWPASLEAQMESLAVHGLNLPVFIAAYICHYCGGFIGKRFNHVFRLSCIHSNRQSPSHNYCKTFAAQYAVKHVALDGSWYDAEKKT